MKPIEPRPMASRAQELQTAKEILAEVFGARPGEVEEMIQMRLEERSWPAQEGAVAGDVLPGGVGRGEIREREEGCERGLRQIYCVSSDSIRLRQS